MTHYGDPCIHCSIHHDNVPAGHCAGDTRTEVIIATCFIGRRHDNCEHWRFRHSTGEISDVWYHIDEVPNLWLNKLRYDDALKWGHP